MKRLADEPFALLGVNSDADREALNEVLEEERITWRSWWDGGSVNGPISTKWQIANWPTIVVLDAKGVIRYRSGGPSVDIDAIERTVDSLLKKGNGAARERDAK